MEYVTLGRTGMKVSRLCFGTMSFGGDADERTSAASTFLTAQISTRRAGPRKCSARCWLLVATR